jgi:hypothetical protein
MNDQRDLEGLSALVTGATSDKLKGLPRSLAKEQRCADDPRLE